jgi:hypothetical protein
VRRALLLLALGLGLALAQPRDCGWGRVTLDEAAPGARVRVTAETDPERSGASELMVFAFRPGQREAGLIRALTPPAAPGVYRLELSLPEAGTWGFTVRYGVGLDLYYATVQQRLEPTGNRSFTQQTAFRGALAEAVPRYAQPLGFAVFGLVLLIAISLVAGVLRHLRRAAVG